MPKLWNETIAEHRGAVRDAIMEKTAALAVEQGLASLTMSQVAESAGVGRATLYKYFPDVETILVAWHQKQVVDHLRLLIEVRDGVKGTSERLQAVLEAYATIRRERHDADLSALLHQGEHMEHAHLHLRDFVRDLVAEGAAAGELRSDVAPDELASYCLHALGAASGLSSKAAVRRLVAVTLAGLRAAA